MTTRETLASLRKAENPPALPLDIASIKSYREEEGQTEKARAELEVWLVPFHSRFDDLPIQYTDEANMHFLLRFYIPKQFSHPFKNLFVLVNGLGDAGPMIYDDIGMELAKHGIPAVLFPLPAHFHRGRNFRHEQDDPYAAMDKDESRIATQAIVGDIAASPEKALYDHMLFMRDLDTFLKTIRGHTKGHNGPLCDFVSKYIDSKAKVYSMGYSLGGLFSLGFYLKNQESVERCCLLESGANFGQINAGILFQRDPGLVRLIWERRFKECVPSGEKTCADLKNLLVTPYDTEASRNAFDDMCTKVTAGTSIDDVAFDERLFARGQPEAERIWSALVYDMAERCPREIQKMKTRINAQEAELFERTILGNQRILYRDQLRKVCTKVFIILGGSDVIFQMDAITSFSPRETGLAILQIPKLGHWLKFSDRRVWREWRRFIVRTIIEFGDIQPPARKSEVRP